MRPSTGRCLRKISRYSLRLSLTVMATAAPAASGHAATVVRRVAAMGTVLEVRVTADDGPTAAAASEAAVRSVEAAERRLSTWRRDSELSRVNAAAPGVPVRLSAATSADLAAALRWAAATGRAFDPACGSLVAAWGLRGGAGEPGEDALERALAAAGPGAVRLEGFTAVKTRPGVRLDAGGFGKGVALDRACRAALGAGARGVALDFGGQVRLAGDVGVVRVAVADPDRRLRAAAVVAVGSGSVATSGDSERRVVTASGRRVGHLIDPRSGRPASDFGSVTVWAASGVAADCLSTALFVMGPEAGMRWLARHPDIEALYLVRGRRGLRRIATPGMRRMLALGGRRLRGVGRPRAD